MRHYQSSRPRAGVESGDTGDGPCMLHFSSEHSKHAYGRSLQLIGNHMTIKGIIQSHGRSSDLIWDHV